MPSQQKITRSKKQLFLAIICGGGLKKNLYSVGRVQGVVTIENLFSE